MRMVVNIDVPDLKQARDFYCAAFDLTLSRMLDDDVAELTGATCVIYLLRSEPGSAPFPGSDESRRYDRHWTPAHIDFVVDDMESARQRVLAAGARQESECVEWRGSKCITFSDPFGHGFCLLSFDNGTYADA
jgi:predicted enzyme related to lactoylglutathione lyase